LLNCFHELGGFRLPLKIVQLQFQGIIREASQNEKEIHLISTSVVRSCTWNGTILKFGPALGFALCSESLIQEDGHMQNFKCMEDLNGIRGFKCS
jgi:hypothetical protein